MTDRARCVLILAREARRLRSGDLWYAADLAASRLYGRMLRVDGIGRAFGPP